MTYADLHVHTTASDGELTPERLPEAAREAGVAVVAITDHDRLHPDLDRPVTTCDGVTVIRGIELRVEAPSGQRVDLLGYGARATAALDAEVERLQRDRIERGRAVVESVEDHTGVELDVEIHEGVGRPHVARAIGDSPELSHDYQDAFDELIGSDCPCYVARSIPSFERGRRVLDDACGLVGLAHPLRYDDSEAALDLTSDLDAVERNYPYGEPVDPAPVERAIREHDLIATGGSDAHDDRLGRAGLSAEEYRPIAAAVEGASAP
ncbi:PHP domain-containing protein [Natronoarchaeum rubrum]|uniref:PHP domain-containing protein n=1 Tax=Natronoarchaeum rubrum TaxID=755311 RepID=UPI00211338A0|nr:PHP domain-containing protein [Natronoarchaeum rubrum]